MIPISGIDFESGIKVSGVANKTYEMLQIDGDNGIQNINGFIDGFKSVRQAIYKVLKTERGRYPIYNSEYGVRLNDLFGKSKVYVYAKLEERVSEALLRDERIIEVYDFVIKDGRNKGEIYLSFKVRTTIGDESISMEVKM